MRAYHVALIANSKIVAKLQILKLDVSKATMIN